MNQIGMKHLWYSTSEKLPATDEEVLGYASSPELENLGYHIVTYNPKTDSWHEVNGRSIPNITHWIPIEPPVNLLVQTHHKQAEVWRSVKPANSNRRESDRNKEIVFRLIDGQTYQEIANAYGISSTRVRNIAIRVMEKIAPDMKFSLADLRKISELIKRRIDQEL